METEKGPATVPLQDLRWPMAGLEFHMLWRAVESATIRYGDWYNVRYGPEPLQPVTRAELGIPPPPAIPPIQTASARDIPIPEQVWQAMYEAGRRPRWRSRRRH